MNTESNIMTTSNASQALAEALGLSTPAPNGIVPMIEVKPLVPRPNASDTQIPADAEYVRQNLYEIIEQGARAIEIAQNLFMESQHPRAGEVLGQLLKTQADNMNQLLKVHADVKKLYANDTIQMPINQTTNIANAIFVGTSDELVRMMRKEHTTPLTIKIDDND